MRIRTAAALAALPLALAACPVGPTLTCTDEARSTLVLEVRDARTGAPAAQGARGTLREGTYSDTLVATSPLHLNAMETWERPGRYDITVEKAGYRTFTRTGVEVGKDACHVRTRTVEVGLEPA
jgi:hypothetical protein